MSTKPRIIIETKRLTLREKSLEDAESMFELHSDPEVQKYTGEPAVQSLDEMRKSIAAKIKRDKQFGYGRWLAFTKEGDEFIGWAGLLYLPEFDEVDIGYRFLPRYWGKGFATEASEAILKYGFEKLNLERIIAIAMKENTASIRVMEKVGMKFDKYAPYEPGGEDVVWYQIKKANKA